MKNKSKVFLLLSFAKYFQFFVEAGIVDIKLIVMIVRGKSGKRKIFCSQLLVLSVVKLHVKFVFVSVQAVVEIFVVIEMLLIEDVIIHRLEHNIAVLLFGKLVVRNRGEEDLLVRFSEADHGNVDLDVLANERGFIIYVLFGHKLRQRIALDKVHGDGLVFIDVADAAVGCFGERVINGFVRGHAENVNLHARKHVGNGRIVFAFEDVLRAKDQLVAKRDVFFIVLLVNNDDEGAALFRKGLFHHVISVFFNSGKF